MTFLLGALFCAVLGVLVDRLYLALTKKTKFKISSEYYFKPKGRKEGVRFSITNVGSQEIHPHHLALYHPIRGSLELFLTEDKNEAMLPGQIRKYDGALFLNKEPIEFLKNWIMADEEVSDLEAHFNDYILRITLDKSKKILFESASIGKALAMFMYNAYRDGSGLKNWMEFHNVCLAYSSLDRFNNWIRTRIGLKSLQEIRMAKILNKYRPYRKRKNLRSGKAIKRFS